MGSEILWAGWQGPARLVLMALLSYAFLIVILRLSGKRTLSKMNAFDFIITIAAGSTFATVLLSKDTSFAEGATAFSMLVFMQYGVAWASARSKMIEAWVKSEPSILVWKGEIQHETLRRNRVTETEVLAACRESGVGALQQVHAVVLETAGELSVIPSEKAAGREGDSTLRSIRSTWAKPPH